MDIKKFVDELSAEDQEQLLTELANRDRIAVHIENQEKTVNVYDVYCNSSDFQAQCASDSDGVLTILLIEPVSE